VPDDVQNKCEKLSAVVKGYLTRRLFRTEKVQSIIKTIWVIITAFLLHLYCIYYCYCVGCMHRLHHFYYV